MTLENLVNRSLDRIDTDQSTITRLLRAADGSLANAQLTGITSEGSFDMAYKAIMQLANAALHAHGYRTLISVPGHHQTLIQLLPQTIGLDSQKMILLESLRKQRNLIDYSGDSVTRELATEAIEHATYLQQYVTDWLQANKPELMN